MILFTTAPSCCATTWPDDSPASLRRVAREAKSVDPENGRNDVRGWGSAGPRDNRRPRPTSGRVAPALSVRCGARGLLVSGPSSGTYCVQDDTLLVRTDTYGMVLQRAGCLGEAQSCASAKDVCPPGCADNSRCEATVFNQNCAKWTNFHDCALLDCNWVVSCAGTPAPCASLSQTACTAQPGCKWVEP
jgi:hypothetical protein